MQQGLKQDMAGEVLRPYIKRRSEITQPNIGRPGVGTTTRTRVCTTAANAEYGLALAGVGDPRSRLGLLQFR